MKFSNARDVGDSNRRHQVVLFAFEGLPVGEVMLKCGKFNDPA
jgi:hypothetical protein